MCLFGNPRKKIEKWASLVMEGYVAGMPVEEEFLDAATTLYIQQHARILYDSIHLVLTSKNEETRKSRYALAQKQFAALAGGYRHPHQNRKGSHLNRSIWGFVLAHELLHASLRHDVRCDEREPELWLPVIL